MCCELYPQESPNIHYYFKAQTVSFRQPIDVLFFLGIAFITVKEFAYNQSLLSIQKNTLAKQESDVKLGMSAARVAHDLRKPFGNLKILLQLIQDNSTDKNLIKNAIARMTPSIDFAENLIDEILATKRQGINQFVNLSLTKFIEILNKTLIENVNFTEIELEIKCNVEGELYIDKNKILVVFQNIISNAIDAMTVRDHKKMWIHFNENWNSIGQKQCQILIGNNGPAIPEEVLGKLFQQEISFGKSNGTGLGLNYVGEVLKSHGALISVSNLPFKRGVEFEINIPLKDLSVTTSEYGNSSANKNLEDSPNRIAANSERQSKMVILIDEDPVIHAIWRIAWPNEDLKLYFNPIEFMKAVCNLKFENQKPTYIITDMFFKGMAEDETIEILQKIKEMNIASMILASMVDVEDLNYDVRKLFVTVKAKGHFGPTVFKEWSDQC